MEEQDLPIDIHTSKLLEWLVSRRHVKKNWASSINPIREKINAALHDMPEHSEILKLLSGSYINYFHCRRIEEILQETEKDTKNFFGFYNSQRMKDWREIIKLYEQDNVYLAEAGQYLLRNVAYEIPSIRKQIAKSSQIQEDCDRRELECNKNISLSKERYYSSCKRIGLKGENVKKELLELLQELPQVFQTIAEQCSELNEPRIFYSDFISFTVPKSSNNCLPLLQFVMDHGDVTVYEWKYGEAPIKIERDELVFTSENSQDQDDKIDFGDDNGIDFGDAVKIDEIDFGDTGEIDFGDAEDLTTGDIDWGDLRIEEGKEEEIDWNIVTSSGDESSQIVVESSGADGGIAKGEEALSILMNESTRNQFINELMELDGFLTQRITELGKEESLLSMTQFISAPKSLQYQNKEALQIHRTAIKQILSNLTSAKMTHLYLISTSPKYVDRLAKSLTDKLKIGDKLLSDISKIQKKREEAIEMQNTLSQQLDIIISRSKELQMNLEKNISLKYKNRPVNLLGGLNAL